MKANNKIERNKDRFKYPKFTIFLLSFVSMCKLVIQSGSMELSQNNAFHIEGVANCFKTIRL